MEIKVSSLFKLIIIILIPPGVRDGRHTPNDPEEYSPEAVEDELRVGVALVRETELLP